uniref:Vacuolar ATP synthase subunit S1 n=1 Tax=Strigamia maritima TaxID=126957 RepID=T1IUV9_STRMM
MAGQFFGVVIFVLFRLISSEFVPILIVGSDSKHVPEKPNYPLHKLSTNEFEMEFMDKMVGNGPLIIFLQDTLSLEDFNTFGDAYSTENKKNSSFSNLKNLLEEKPFLLLSAVEKPENGFKKIEENWNVLKLNIDSNLSSNFDITSKTLIFVELPKTETANNRLDNLKRNDEIIGKILAELESMTNEFVMLFTARHSSWSSDEGERVRISRHILEVEPTEEGFVLYDRDRDNSTMMYIRNATFKVLKDENKTVDTDVQLKISDFSVSTTSDNKTTLFKLTITPKEPALTELVLNFEFVKLRGNWVLNSLNSTVTSDKINGDFEMQTRDVWAPGGMSYNCKQAGLFQNKMQKQHAFAIKFDNLQVESFMKKLTFGYPYDCVGFFTIPILTSIFVTIILILVLAFGIQQIFNINTMDRFDDPKGKTITVPSVD